MLPELRVETMKVADLVPYAGNAKEHPDRQVREIAESIERFGMCDPVGIWHDADGRPVIVEGHGRVLALEQLGMAEVPVIALDHLTDDERRAYVHVHNQTTLTSGFDFDALNVEMAALPDFDWAGFGFDWQLCDMDDFGTDFTLPDADAPQLRSLTLNLTQEQFALVDAALELVDECSTAGGNETARKVAEVCRLWAGL